MDMSPTKYLNPLRRLLPLAVIAGVLLGVSCSNDECYDNKNSLPLAGFYSSDSEPQKISLSRISILGVGAPGDSVLQDSVSGLTQSYLPFRIDQGQTIYEILYLEGELGERHVSDRITFNYEIIPWFVSSACGVSYNYKITSIETTHNVIDSVTCPLGVIDNKDIENIHIYFRVSQSDEGSDVEDNNGGV